MGLERFRHFVAPKIEMAVIAPALLLSLLCTIGQAAQCTDDNYRKTGNGWTFNRKQVTEADLATFRVLTGPDPYNGNIPCGHDSGYAIDAFHAYWHGEVVAGADPKTFSYLQFDYSHDANHVYYRAANMSGADPRTFTSIYRRYFKDSAHVYLRGAAIRDADPATFSLLSKSWYLEDRLARDKAHVFFGAEVVYGANPKDTADLTGPYWVSNRTIFCENRTLGRADADSFRIASKDEEAFEAEDRSHYFLRNQILDKGECRTVGPAILACKSYVWVLGYRYSHLDATSLHYLGNFPSQHCGQQGTPLYQDRRGVYVLDSNRILERILHTRQYPRIEHLDKYKADRICKLSGTAEVWPDGWFDRKQESSTSSCPQ
jgi:hypothetical protein